MSEKKPIKNYVTPYKRYPDYGFCPEELTKEEYEKRMDCVDKIQLRNDIERDKAMVKRLEKTLAYVDEIDERLGDNYRTRIDIINARIVRKEEFLKNWDSKSKEEKQEELSM